MDPIVLATGSALVSAAATDGWQHVRDAVAGWWRRVRPQQAAHIGTDLDELRARVMAARSDVDTETEQALAGTWRLRLQQLLDEDPTFALELRRLLDEHLVPALSPGEGDQARAVVMRAEARDSARVYMAGGDQHITGA